MSSEQQIRYCRTSDGVDIAFYTLGEGEPFIHMPMIPFSHIQLDWSWPEFRQGFQLLAQKRMLVRYDCRGTGLSDRSAPDYSRDSLVLDLEAVVQQLGLDRFSLCGSASSGPVAVSYAGKHPEKVSHLVLWGGYVRGADYAAAPQYRGVMALLDTDWELFTETTARLIFGWTAADAAQRYALLMRECVTPEVARAMADARQSIDVSALLPLVRAPTLVLHPDRYPLLDIKVAKEIASRIADARLVVVPEPIGIALSPQEGCAWLSEIDVFLGHGPTEPPSARQSAFRAVLFTDLVGHTEMMSRLGDERGRAVLREHETITRNVLKQHGGTEVKTMGDGFMASFGSVTKAVECAIALQRAFAEREGEPLSVRVGLNAGEPIEEEGDLFGATVILASRIAAKAAGGEILVADTVRGLCSGKGFLFSDRGEFVAKGFEEPVRVYEVKWRDEA